MVGNNNIIIAPEIRTFYFEECEIRVAIVENKPWLVLSDVCEALGIENSRNVTRRLDDDEKGVYTMDTLGGPQKITIINESGFYQIILLSRKPNAKQFKRWITHDVLPSISKTGSYSVYKLSEEERMQDLLALDGDIVIAYGKKLKQAAELETKVVLLENKIEHDKPKIIFADAVSVSDTDILIGELAKILKGNGIEIGQNRLFERLRQDGFLIKRKGTDYNTPTQKSMELGLFRIIEAAITHSDGHVTISKTTKVTGKGQQYFVNYFLNEDMDDSQINEELITDVIDDNSNLIEANHGL
ncbi:MAG: phage antirepressor KilAC domain-containing protein [Holosporales bacterium]|jgi:anti-repressor protein|nr:phage antirepressor KilAC domain-containing protein [Holosporales bacterium]